MRALWTALTVSTGVAAFGTSAQAAQVFFDDFSGETAGAAPTSGATTWGVYNSGGSSTLGISTTVGNAAPSVAIVDTSTSATTYGAINMGAPAFSSFNMQTAGQEVLTIGFDFRVDSFSNSNNGHGSTARVSLNDAGHYFLVGIGRNNIDADADSDVFLYAYDSGASNSPASLAAAQAIGYAAGTGWTPGFDLGAYSTTDSSQNRTNGWYRIELTFTAGSTAVGVKATNLTTSQVLNVERTAGSAYSFSNTSSDILAMWAPQSGSATAYLDNVRFDSRAVPEPASLGLLGLAGLALARRRR